MGVEQRPENDSLSDCKSFTPQELTEQETECLKSDSVLQRLEAGERVDREDEESRRIGRLLRQLRRIQNEARYQSYLNIGQRPGEVLSKGYLRGAGRLLKPGIDFLQNRFIDPFEETMAITQQIPESFSGERRLIRAVGIPFRLISWELRVIRGLCGLPQPEKPEFPSK